MWEKQVKAEIELALPTASSSSSSKKKKTEPKKPPTDPLKSIDLATVAEGLYADHSQNSFRSAAGKGIRTITTKTELYSFTLDRQILAREHFGMLMQGQMNFAGMSNFALRDLAGHGLSSPNAALIQAALLLATDLPGLWELQAAPNSFK